jgi:hypothetical protein
MPLLRQGPPSLTVPIRPGFQGKADRLRLHTLRNDDRKPSQIPTSQPKDGRRGSGGPFAVPRCDLLEIEKLGHRYHSSIVGGIIELYEQGSWFVATIIFAFSIVLPAMKLATLLELCWLKWLEHHHRAWAYRIIEFSGRWSMLDVMLLAFLVMLVKLSGLVEFHVGPAVIAFAGCVAMSMIASMTFDPHSIWGD